MGPAIFVRYNRVNLCIKMTNSPSKSVRHNHVFVNNRVRYNRVSLYLNIHYGTQLMLAAVFLPKNWWHRHICLLNSFFVVLWIATAYNQLDVTICKQPKTRASVYTQLLRSKSGFMKQKPKALYCSPQKPFPNKKFLIWSFI